MRSSRSLVRVVLVTAFTVSPLLAACGGKGEAAGGGDDDFSAATLAATQVDVKGQKVTVSLPQGFVRDADSPFIAYVAPAKDNFSLPKFTFRLETTLPPKALADLKLESGTKQKPMVEKKRAEVAGGLLVAGVNATGGTAELVFWRLRPDGAGVSCRAVQARSAGVPNVDATLAMFEKACTSMTLE
ncbi:MAG: hypothetical protein KC635_14385 [Myxococcales bacterium]|nr:hypothetical protein [Myxococcales bacterium]MCB9732948.1 hypothetical protein [Deltaproteobacteria bacterium]